MLMSAEKWTLNFEEETKIWQSRCSKQSSPLHATFVSRVLLFPWQQIPTPNDFSSVWPAIPCLNLHCSIKHNIHLPLIKNHSHQARKGIAADSKGHLSLVDGGRLAKQSSSCLKQTGKLTNGQSALGLSGIAL